MNDLNATIRDSTIYFSHSLLFGIFTPIYVLSVPCYLFIFIQFCRKRRLCRVVHNHLLLIILAFSFLQIIIEQPLTLSYLHTNIALIQSANFCKFWITIDFVLGSIILMLMSYGSIERYLLFFHRAFIFRHLIILHYLPIILCIIYPFLFYMGMIYIYPCINHYDYTLNICGGPCYVIHQLPSIFNQLFNLALIEMIGVLTNIVLISRVLYKKRRMKQQNMWKKNRRLLIQVLSITSLHNIMLLLTVIAMLIGLFSPTPQPILVYLTFNVFSYGLYLTHLLCPFVSLVGLSQLWPHSISRFLRHLLIDNTVQPTIHIPINAHGRMHQQLTRATKHNKTN